MCWRLAKQTLEPDASPARPQHGRRSSPPAASTSGTSSTSKALRPPATAAWVPPKPGRRCPPTDAAAPLNPPSGGAAPSSAPSVDRAAVVARLQAQHAARGSDKDKPAPWYFGTPENPAGPRNEIEFDERKANWTCFGCTLEQRKAQGAIPHLLCMYYRQDSSDNDRASRVAGLGPATLTKQPILEESDKRAYKTCKSHRGLSLSPDAQSGDVSCLDFDGKCCNSRFNGQNSLFSVCKTSAARASTGNRMILYSFTDLRKKSLHTRRP
jgi:hypothetical protein